MHMQCSNASTCSRVEIWRGGTPSPPPSVLIVVAAIGEGWPSVLSDSRVQLSKSKKMGFGTIFTQWVRISRNRHLKIVLESFSEAVVLCVHLLTLMNWRTKLTSRRLSSLTLNSFCTFPIIPTKLSKASSTWTLSGAICPSKYCLRISWTNG